MAPAAPTPVPRTASGGGVAELEAQLAATQARVAELEAQLAAIPPGALMPPNAVYCMDANHQRIYN